MEKDLNIFDIIYDENNDQNIIMYNEKNEPVEFEQIAYVPIEDKDYVILKPVEPFENMAEDEALVFEMVEDEKGQDLVFVVDDEVVDNVFDIYNKLYDQMSEEDK